MANTLNETNKAQSILTNAYLDAADRLKNGGNEEKEDTPTVQAETILT
jgi:hypothetical protein